MPDIGVTVSPSSFNIPDGLCWQARLQHRLRAAQHLYWQKAVTIDTPLIIPDLHICGRACTSEAQVRVQEGNIQLAPPPHLGESVSVRILASGMLRSSKSKIRMQRTCVHVILRFGCLTWPRRRRVNVGPFILFTIAE